MGRSRGKSYDFRKCQTSSSLSLYCCVVIIAIIINKNIYFLPRQSEKCLLLHMYHSRNGPHRTEMDSFLPSLLPISTVIVENTFMALSLWWEDHSLRRNVNCEKFIFAIFLQLNII